MLANMVDLKLIYIITFGFLGGMIGVILAASLLLFSDKTRGLMTTTLFSYAIGTLLGVSFIDLLPHAIEHENYFLIILTVIFGIGFFYALGKLISGQHIHETGIKGNTPDEKVGKIILIGASLHNFIDGIIIAAAFFQSFASGLIVTLSIIAHEIPHEIGDFVILLESGYSKKKALVYNIITGLSTLFGSILSYLFLTQLERLTPFIMALAASSFIYITFSELAPKLKKPTSLIENIKQILLILLGVFTIAILEHGHG
jgi:zinc and cadmium transporter